MKYRNYEVGFTFEVPDDFSEVKQSSYEVFNVPADTMHHFIQLDDNGDIVRSFSITKSEPMETDDQIKEYIDKNLAQLDELGIHKVVQNQIQTTDGRTIDRVVLYDENMKEDLGILTYFMKVKNVLIMASCYIVEFYDEYEEELYDVFDSIKEV